MAPVEQGDSRLSTAESEDQSCQAGDAPGESKRLSQACVWLYVCRAAAQGAGLWPVEPLTLMSIGGCFVLLLRSMSRCCCTAVDCSGWEGAALYCMRISHDFGNVLTCSCCSKSWCCAVSWRSF